jgi:ABC-type transporter Mla subunit MlaD
MKNVADLFQKLELRYQKRVEIALERERRRKKAERRPLVFLGDSAALKQLDKDFNTMEKRNILDAAKDRDERTNRLMDCFDEAIMRGLGENQSLLDDISAKVKKIDPKLVDHSADIEQTLTSISTLVRFLGTDSEAILGSFGIADRALNNADYDVSVAEARLSNSGADIFRRLDEEKKKEDRKIQDDLDNRMKSVTKGPQEVVAKIQEVLGGMNQAGPRIPSQLPPPPEKESPSNHPAETLMPGLAPEPNLTPEEEQQERHRRALEEAKRRNAAKTVS